MELSVFRADPAGNITLFVQSFVMQEKRAEAATRLMARFDAEQVAFVVPGGDADGATEMMVKVVSTDTLVWESGCGSGSLAAAAESFGTAEGVFGRSYIQRAGAILARLKYRKGVIEEASIGGKVSFDAPITVKFKKKAENRGKSASVFSKNPLTKRFCFCYTNPCPLDMAA